MPLAIFSLKRKGDKVLLVTQTSWSEVYNKDVKYEGLHVRCIVYMKFVAVGVEKGTDGLISLIFYLITRAADNDMVGYQEQIDSLLLWIGKASIMLDWDALA